MPFDGSKPMPAQDLLDEFIHRQTHLIELREKFPDILAQDLQNSMELRTASINPIVDKIRFDYQYVDKDNNTLIYYAFPYLEYGQDCEKCKERKDTDENLTIVSDPIRIPLLLVSDYTEPTYLYTFDYEDFLAEHKFSKYIYDQCRLHLIEVIQRSCSRSRPKKNEVVIPSGVKKLLIFS